MKPTHNLNEKIPTRSCAKRKHTVPAETQAASCLDPNWKLLEELQNVTSELAELKHSVQYMSDKYDDLLKQFQIGKEETKLLREEITQLTEHNASLNSRFEIIERDWNQDKQELIRNNVVVFGFSDQANSKQVVNDTVKILLRKANMEDPEALTDCYQRQLHNNQAGSIVMKFKNPILKNDFLKIAKRLDLQTSDIGLSTRKSNRIRLSEQLTPMNQQLLNEARQLRTHGYKFIWSKNGRIMARKTATSNIVVIHNYDCIDSLKSSNQTI